MFDADKHVIYAGEAWLVNWGDTSSRGRTVTVELPQDLESHPFRDLAVRSGKRAGQRMMVAFTELGDDERPVEQSRPLSQEAAVLCKDPGFWAYAAERSISVIDSEQAARQWMLDGAGVTSRRAFDTEPAAAQWFIRQVKAPYEAYRRALAEGAL